jgi:hypothetical protein
MLMKYRYLLPTLLLATVTGCAGTASIPLQLTRYRSALDYYAWVVAAGTEDLDDELSQLQAEATTAPVDTVNAVRTALVLGARNQAGDRQLALDLLQKVEDNSPVLPVMDSEYEVLAHLWSDYLQTGAALATEQDQRLATQDELQQQQQDKEALLQQILQQDEVLATTQRNSRLLERQNSLLQQQLEALTDIEQQLMTRESEGDGEE